MQNLTQNARVNDPAVMQRAFVMLNAAICDPPAELDERTGFYDPKTQTWKGRIRIGAGSYSSRSNGSKGGYSYTSDD